MFCSMCTYQHIFVNLWKSLYKIFSAVSVNMDLILHVICKKALLITACFKNVHAPAWLTRNDWFLAADVIDPWAVNRKASSMLSLTASTVLLGRWEEREEKWRPSVFMVPCPVLWLWCKQLHLSEYDEPWTVTTFSTSSQPPSPQKAVSATPPCFRFSHMSFMSSFGPSKEKQVYKVSGLSLHQKAANSAEAWLLSEHSLKNIHGSVHELSTSSS